MLQFLRNLIPDHHPLRLAYHRVVSFFASVRYFFPARKLRVITVTGTSGKSTTCHFVATLLEEAGYKVGLMTTIGFRVAGHDFVNDTKMTTLGRFALQKFLRAMVNAGCTYAVIEVTSHALVQSRIAGVHVDVALLTNMTGDHVEYHGGFEGYRRAKAKLFEMLSGSKARNKTMFLNADDAQVDFFDNLDVTAEKKYFYGLHSSRADFFADQLDFQAHGTSFRFHSPFGSARMEVSLPGVFNVYNALAAASIVANEGVPLSVLKKGLAQVRALPGRFERIDEGQNFTVVVDYAHTPDSLRGLLQMYKDLKKGKLIVVFGATGGGRDKGKRAPMGAAAHELADEVIVTTDDAYSEDEWNIIEMVSVGIPRREGEHFWKIVDRREAIAKAFTLAEKDDVVVIAGKGCEPVQLTRGLRLEWDDRKVAREFLKNR